MVKGGLNSRKGIFYLLFSFSILSSSLVFALDDWQTFQKDPAGTATQTGSGSYNNDTTHIVKTIYGNNYQPLVADIDNDNEMEIVIFSRSMLQIYDKYLNITHEFAVGTLLSQPSLANYDGDSYLDIIALVSTNNVNYYKAFEYNGGSLQELQSITIGSNVGNLKCIDFNGNSNVECIYKDADGMVHGYEYGSSSDTLNINVSGGTGSDTRGFNPPLKDFDTDTNVDAVFVHNSAITAIDKNGVKWQISGTPYTDYLLSTSVVYTNPGSGNSSIIIAFQNSNAASCSVPSSSCTSHINSYLANGTLSWSQGHYW
ncbi:MAG: hypothetical protein Q8L34_01960, partial [Candidatus Woesearchaeota archaeon]|nr:hypothetical protein [Candidatus Woesearchaeota archaeon]